jgi:hypothetical protein
MLIGLIPNRASSSNGRAENTNQSVEIMLPYLLAGVDDRQVILLLNSKVLRATRASAHEVIKLAAIDAKRSFDTEHYRLNRMFYGASSILVIHSLRIRYTIGTVDNCWAMLICFRSAILLVLSIDINTI